MYLFIWTYSYVCACVWKRKKSPCVYSCVWEFVNYVHIHVMAYGVSLQGLGWRCDGPPVRASPGVFELALGERKVVVASCQKAIEVINFGKFLNRLSHPKHSHEESTNLLSWPAWASYHSGKERNVASCQEATEVINFGNLQVISPHALSWRVHEPSILASLGFLP